jgi:glycosyltransferase involved in cell wall biosynthesis
MNHPKVSIVIPVYNGEDFLAEAIDSALAQTYDNIEIVVVDDGSDDDGATLRVAQSYGDKVRLFSKPNGGVASALNRAITEMTGDYFSWLSHDDLYTEDKVEKELRALHALGRDDAVIYSDYAVFTDNPKDALPVHLKGVPPEQFRYWITVENQLHGCTLLVPRTAFEKVGRFDESLRTTQDYDLWYRMAGELPFFHIPEVLVKARSHAEQGSHKMAGIALTECNNLLSNFIAGLDEREILASTGKPLGASYAEIASSMYRRGFDQAGSLARQYASENGLSSTFFLGDRIMNLGRTLLPPKVKHRIKAVIHSTVNKAAGKIEESPEALKQKFSEVYEKNIFGGRISRSGEGSDLVQTEVIRRELPKIVEQYSIRTFLDAPCGDWYWMQETDLGVEQYIGVDIVEPMIEKHNRTFASPGRTFLCLNLATDPLPKADLIFSRDCLVHLTFDDALKIIANFKRSGAKYLLTTTFVDRKRNNDLVGVDKFWRALNMCLPPFNFPEPLLLVNEGCTEEAEQYTDKSLGLWLLNDIDT